MDEKLEMTEELVEITTPQTEEISPSDMAENPTATPLENAGDGGSPEQQNPNTSAMGKPIGLFEQLGEQYEKVNERPTPNGGSITDSLEPALKRIEDSVRFEQTDSDNYEANVQVGGLGGKGGVDLDAIDSTSSDEYEAIMQRDAAINRKEITHIDNQRKVYDFETELQGQQDDGKGILSNAANKNGDGTTVNPETHVLDAHGGINCKVEENYTEDATPASNNSNDQFNSGDLMTPKDGSSTPDDDVVEDQNDIQDDEDVVSEEITEDTTDEDIIDTEESLEADEDFENGNESEEEMTDEMTDDNTTTTTDIDMTEDDSDDVDMSVDSGDSMEMTDTASVDVDDEETTPEDMSSSDGTYTVTRIPGIADDEGHGDDLSEKADQLDTPNFEEHGVFDGSDQAANINTDGENGTNEEPTSPEHSTRSEGDISEEQIEKQEDSGSFGDDLEGYGEPEDRSEDADDTNNMMGDSDDMDEDTTPDEYPHDDINEDDIDEDDTECQDTDSTVDTNDSIDMNEDTEDVSVGEESHYMYNNYDYHGYNSGYESEEIAVLTAISDLVD